MNSFALFGIIAGVVILFIILSICMYVKAPPSVAYVLSGLKKEPRILVGTGGFKIPIIERLDKVFLGQSTVDVKTSMPVPTHDFIDVMVDAVCKVRVMPTPEGTPWTWATQATSHASTTSMRATTSASLLSSVAPHTVTTRFARL